MGTQGVAPTAGAFADAQGVADLCRQHGPAIHAYLTRRAGRQGADDLFNEVWLQTHASRSRYDRAAGSPLPWLYGIARNVLRAHWRQLGRAEAALEAVQPEPWGEVDDRLDAASQMEDLRAALALLSDDEREVLLLVAWERLSPAEAAETLGIPQGTARSRLHRARALMQGELAPRPVTISTGITKEHHS
jgi:RNA polymerase sigma-70 factor (ECF subfamily)